MAYIGNSPALKYASFAVQHFTTSATTGYTLDNAVTNENGIALFINNVRQQPGSSYAYTVSGTTLTLSAATTTSDTMYCVFIGKAVQTVNPPAGSVAASQLATDAVTTVKILDTAVTGAKLNDDAISGQGALGAEPADTDEFLVSDAGVLKRVDYSYIKASPTDEFRPNAQPFIINGGMEVNQRTGTTATSFVNNTYGVDRWINYLNGSCVLNYQQLTRSSSIVTDLQTDSGKNFDNVLMLDCTSSASLGASDLLSVLQLIEGYVHNPMAGKAITLSFWVRSNLTGTYCVAFKEGSAKTYVVEYTISSADTWEQKIITLTDDTLANYSSNTSTTNGSSLQVNFSLRLGTTAQQTTADAWNTGNFYGTSNQVTWGASTSDFWYIAGVQLEMGTYTSSTLPPFQFENYGDNLQRCLRYAYVKLNDTADHGALYSTGLYIGTTHFPVIMRTTPTVTLTGGNSVTSIIQTSLNGFVINKTSDGAYVQMYNAVAEL